MVSAKRSPSDSPKAAVAGEAFVPHFFCLAKRNGVRPKEKRFLPALGAVEPYAGGVGGVVIPKQDTFLSNADRSLSR